MKEAMQEHSLGCEEHCQIKAAIQEVAQEVATTTWKLTTENGDWQAFMQKQTEIEQTLKEKLQYLSYLDYNTTNNIKVEFKQGTPDTEVEATITIIGTITSAATGKHIKEKLITFIIFLEDDL